jgi:hypothetical protein
MSEDYRSRWADLVLDPAVHDALLSVLGKAYQANFSRGHHNEDS